MSLLNDLRGKITKSGQETVKKAKSIAGIAKINNQISEEQRTLATFYAQLGEKYYSLKKDAPAEEFSQICDRITAGLMRIAELQTEVQRLKNTRLCPKCGAACPTNVQFCSKCGAQLPQIEQEQEQEEGQDQDQEEQEQEQEEEQEQELAQDEQQEQTQDE